MPKRAPKIEARIVSVEDQENKHDEQFIDMVKDIEQKENSALILATSNPKVIAENTERISSQQFDYQSLVEKIEALVTKNKELTDEIEDSKNRRSRKTSDNHSRGKDGIKRNKP